MPKSADEILKEVKEQLEAKIKHARSKNYYDNDYYRGQIDGAEGALNIIKENEKPDSLASDAEKFYLVVQQIGASTKSNVQLLTEEEFFQKINKPYKSVASYPFLSAAEARVELEKNHHALDIDTTICVRGEVIRLKTTTRHEPTTGEIE